MGIFGAIKKIAGQAMEVFDNLVNEDELDAVVAATVLIAGADGKIDDAEKEAAFKAVSSHDSLKSFSKEKIRARFDNFANLINSDKVLAEEVLFDKVSSIKDKIARIRVIGIANQIAMADGEFSASEKAVVDKIRRVTA